MAVLRERPYGQFNFLVDLGTGNTDGPEAGFQECSEIGMSVDVIEYRNGNEKENNVRKLTGLARVSDVTLKLGQKPNVRFNGRHDEEDWTVTLAETGENTLTAGRIRRIACPRRGARGRV